MASTFRDIAFRTMARIRRAWGITSPSDISDSNRNIEENVHYGMFMEEELRHVDGILNAYDATKGQKKAIEEQDVSALLMATANDTRKKIDEVKNLKIMAPEITTARDLIISSIMSPVDLQTDSVTVQVSHPGLPEKTNAAITSYLTNYFNKEYQLGPKIVEWLGCAGFEEGAKPILVLPKRQIDILNTVADQWDPDRQKEFEEYKRAVRASQESLIPKGLNDESEAYKKMLASVEAFAVTELNKTIPDGKIDLTENDVKVIEASNEELKPNLKAPPKPPAGGPMTVTTAAIAKNLAENSFKLLRTTERGDAVIVTRDMSDLGKYERKMDARLTELQKEAERQIRGFKASDKDGQTRPTYPVLTISDVIKVGKDDLPIVIEFPCDSVIPVCAPNDNKNHIGYYILLDENGQPCRGTYAFANNSTSDVVNKMATDAAKSVYGAQAIQSYTRAGMTNAQMLDQMTQVFACAVNQLLRTKLTKEGLTGLDIHVHEAVGKSMFFNLLAKNRIKMIFVPSPMLIYYRFAHREDGTGKTFLEDIAYMLGLRTTLTIAKVMAAVDNATLHRNIEINVDEKNQNVLETLELARHAYLSKKVPQITTDPSTAAENIISSHLSITPKGLVGNTDDLSVNIEKSYGNSQAPDGDLMETINNWIGQGLHVPASALNQLKETEYAKSVATVNLFFSNFIRSCQTIVRPFNKKFVINYTLANDQMLQDIRGILTKAQKGSTTATKEGPTPKTPDDPSESKNLDAQHDETVDEELKRIIASMEVVLPPPNMSTSKAHFEEVQAQTEAVNKILEVMFPDDMAPNDELKGLMTTIRALMAAKVIREFLPKLGFHEIAAVPDLEELDDGPIVKAILRLGSIKKRADNQAALQAGKLRDQAKPEGGDSSTFSSPSSGSDFGGGEEPGTGENNGETSSGGDDFGIPSFKI